MREAKGNPHDDKTRWLAGCAALAIGASLGWSLADLVSSPPIPTGHGPELPPQLLPRANPRPPHPVLPRALADAACPFEIVEGRPEPTPVEVVSGLDEPVSLSSPPNDPRLFVVERRGRIRIVEGGEVLDPPFFARRPIAPGRDAASEAQGVVFGTLAFHPEYQDNGRFFLSLVDPGLRAHRIIEARVSSYPDRADDASLFSLLEVRFPAESDEAAALAFGPDGYLYIGLGDGGELGKLRHFAQRTDTLLGKILRLDVDRAGPMAPYEIPDGNWQAPRARREIWAIGLHRPRHLAFDRRGLFVVDIGETAIDEVNLLSRDESGPNLGWSFVEGLQCLAGRDCDLEGLHLPLVELRREPKDCELVGGYVYRGCSMPALDGEYIHGNRCGAIHSFDPREAEAALDLSDRELLVQLPGLVALGEDAYGELYAISDSGRLFRIGAGP